MCTTTSSIPESPASDTTAATAAAVSTGAVAAQAALPVFAGDEPEPTKWVLSDGQATCYRRDRTGQFDETPVARAIARECENGDVVYELWVRRRDTGRWHRDSDRYIDLFAALRIATLERVWDEWAEVSGW